MLPHRAGPAAPLGHDVDRVLLLPFAEDGCKRGLHARDVEQEPWTSTVRGLGVPEVVMVIPGPEEVDHEGVVVASDEGGVRGKGVRHQLPAALGDGRHRHRCCGEHGGRGDTLALVEVPDFDGELALRSLARRDLDRLAKQGKSDRTAVAVSATGRTTTLSWEAIQPNTKLVI